MDIYLQRALPCIPFTRHKVTRSPQAEYRSFALQATYLMFHFVEGVPFESNSGVYDRLTLWEQIDGGAQYTPAKKWLTSLPIILYVVLTLQNYPLFLRLVHC